MENRLKNGPASKRIFGKDITNLQRRSKVHSISEKTPQLLENRVKSRSFDRKAFQQCREPINDHELDILAFILSLQQTQKKEIMVSINAEMRQILIDWLVDVHSSFELKEQTLYLALAYLNEYSSMVDISKNDYQLVGVACLWIASKYEEIYPPRMQNYIQVTDSSYSASQLKAMEGKILLALNFSLNYITPLSILQTVSDKWLKEPSGKQTKQSQRTLAMTKYIMQLSLFQGLAREYCMKTIVLSALMLSDSVLKVKSDAKMLEDEKIEREALMRCFREMCLALQNVSRANIKLKAIRKKYGLEKYLAVARFRIEQK